MPNVKGDRFVILEQFTQILNFKYKSNIVLIFAWLSSSENSGLKRYDVQMRIIAPAECLGKPLENWVVA